MCVRLELQSLTSLSTARPKGTVLNAVRGLCTRLQIAVWSIPVRALHFDPRRRRTMPRARWGRRHHPAGRRGAVHGQIDARVHAVAVAGVGNTAHNDARGCILRHESHGTQHQQRHHWELVIHEIRTSFHKNRRAPPPVLFHPSEKICAAPDFMGGHKFPGNNARTRLRQSYAEAYGRSRRWRSSAPPSGGTPLVVSAEGDTPRPSDLG